MRLGPERPLLGAPARATRGQMERASASTLPTQPAISSQVSANFVNVSKLRTRTDTITCATSPIFLLVFRELDTAP